MRNTIIRICRQLGILSDKRVFVQIFNNYSPTLQRTVRVDIYKPRDFYWRPFAKYAVLYINDGQDLAAMDFRANLEVMMVKNAIRRVIVVAIHANERRMQEYGTAHQADYKNRGHLANIYSDFITKEMIPFVRDKYKLRQRIDYQAIAGFSLGGLSAFDIAWSHPQLFNKVGVFSGSFWWRSKKMESLFPGKDRIVINLLQASEKQIGLSFWLQAGTRDEEGDRNQNYIIDAIDDTLDVIVQLKALGYQDKDIHYQEIENGIHHPSTWKDAMPHFLTWAFGEGQSIH